ncbi:uncharacterized protein LOC134832868 [Culicoides brevitarsis]|uniref:uncharacterized protein LOC134832868 n=1 Tax=Culicoides brevitarsis TaxID=469753 RepID=UPI00307BE834
MDIYYMGDCTSYASLRSIHHRDYEKYPYGSLENAKVTPMKSAYCLAQEKAEQNKQKSKKKDSCPFCKEQKKRPLVAYMRKRECTKRNESICEEEEHQEPEETTNHNATDKK